MYTIISFAIAIQNTVKILAFWAAAFVKQNIVNSYGLGSS